MDGKTKRIGRERAIVLDVIRLARKVPSFPVERWFELAEVDRARQAARQRISWITLFARAYGLAGCEVAELRQAYLGWPVPRVYQSPYSVISVAVNRQTEQGARLLFGRLRFPEQRSLVEIQSRTGYLCDWRCASGLQTATAFELCAKHHPAIGMVVANAG